MPKDAARYGRQGLEAAKKKNWPEAIENYKKLTEADPKDGKNYIYLGLAYRSSGNKEEAVAALPKAIELAPKNSGRLFTARFQLSHAGENMIFAIADTTEVPTSWIRATRWRTVIAALPISGSRIGKMRWRIMTLC